MDAVTLARIQFAFTIGFHFLIVPVTLGLSVFLVLAERRYHRSGDPRHRQWSDFIIKLFTTAFGIGVATGVSMEFAFGTNWASYSRFVGDIFGAPLAAEGVFAFFLESTFLGVLLFGRQRISRHFYYAAAWLVAFGAHLSALWIIIANSWQQTPAGFKVEDGRAVLTDFFAAAINHSTVWRYLHTVLATWEAGAFLVVGIAAYYMLKRREPDFARVMMKWALGIGLGAALALPVVGHQHAVQVAAYQPVKLAAFEGQFTSETNAPMWLVGWVDESSQKTLGIPVPGLLSLLVTGRPSGEIEGLDRVGPEDRPPLQLTFQTYHLMILLGLFFIVVTAVALVTLRRDRLEGSPRLLKTLMWSAPLPILAIQSGWAAAEVGRQPWIVYGQLRTVDAVSAVVPAWQIAATLAVFVVIYTVLFVGWMRISLGIVAQGPTGEAAIQTAPSTDGTVPIRPVRAH